MCSQQSISISIIYDSIDGIPQFSMEQGVKVFKNSRKSVKDQQFFIKKSWVQQKKGGGTLK